MKKTLSILLALSLIVVGGGVIAGASSARSRSSATSKSQSDVLVVYFTMPERDGTDAVSGASRLVVNGKVVGATRRVANWIRSEVDGALFAIRTKKTYPADHETLVDVASEEKADSARPELARSIANLDQYDTIFIGYPNWWGDMPMAMYSFFEDHDFSGKTIIPFNTHGGSGFSSTVATIKELEPNATVSDDGLTIPRDDVATSKSDVLKWLEGLDY